MRQSLPDYLVEKNKILPPRLETEYIVEQIISLLNEENGATYHPYFGNVSGQQLWAVAPYLDRSRKTRDKQRLAVRLQRFIEENEDLLSDPEHSIGVWYNTDNRTYYLDVVVTLSSKEEAMLLGQRENQIAIYDLEAGYEIPTGGTGE